jgi:ribonuclease Y
MTIIATSYTEGFVVLALGLVSGYGLWAWKFRQMRNALALEQKSILENARREADSLAREARLAAEENALALKKEAEQVAGRRLQEIKDLEHRLEQREGLFNRQLEGLMQQEKLCQERQRSQQEKEDALAIARQEIDGQIQHWREQLAQLAHLNQEAARELLLKELEQEVRQDAADLNRHIMEDTKAKAEEEARRIIGLAIQRYAGDHASETSTSAITLPSEEIKGRIIGREGRNIRSFEAATGVTVLIDDTPNAVVLSSFDPVRREIAHESMLRLLSDGRIHPTRIEEIVAKVSQEIEDAILRAGEEAVFKAGLPPMPLEIVKMLGRLRFRFSYAQNILNHSIEVAHLAGILAAELGMDISAAKRAGLLHDIGKALNHEVEGSHALIGAEFLQRHGESEAVCSAVAAHHGDAHHAHPISVLVSAADAISASRPGARSETMTTYLKRLENLEKIARTFAGVEKCYAVQAGRELRVLVHPEQVSDQQAYTLARNLVRKIEDELQYPGQIRVTVIRETRFIEFAK